MLYHAYVHIIYVVSIALDFFQAALIVSYNIQFLLDAYIILCG